MEIVGIGTDIIECSRIGKMIEQHGELFLTRVYTPSEIRYCHANRDSTERFAGRWAAKEAILKCLGTGWRNGIAWTDMEIRNDPTGAPHVYVSGVAREHALEQGISKILISISHCRAYATAYAMGVTGSTPLPPIPD
ncbi:MAG: holo-ACP synthase [Gemmataceae bacterium]